MSTARTRRRLRSSQAARVRQRTSDLLVATVAAGAVALGAHEAGRGQVRGAEARWFAGLNGISERWLAPAWLVMQAGSLGGSQVIGGVVVAAGDRRLGRRLAGIGALAWTASKVVKPFARRGRPSSVVHVARVLGREQAGLGYPSGHAAVAAGMAAVALPHVAPRGRVALFTLTSVVAASRVYVGAHLPLDVAGGAALGVAVERGVRVVRGRV